MSTSNSKDLDSLPTIRSLGGEFWAEVSARMGEEKIQWQIKNELVDLFMGVLARHIGKQILDDDELPVEPLERSEKIL